MEPQKGAKQAQMAQTSLEKRAKVQALVSDTVWAPAMILDNYAVTADASIRSFNPRIAACLADVLEQAILLPKDMNELRQIRKHKVFFMLKKELTLVRLPFKSSSIFIHSS